MTSLIRGFDESLRDSIRALGPNTIFVQRFGVTSFADGASFRDLVQRPNLTVDDARRSSSKPRPMQLVDIGLGGGGPPDAQRVFYGDRRPSRCSCSARPRTTPKASTCRCSAGRFFNGTEVAAPAPSSCSATRPTRRCSADGIDPIGKPVRIGAEVHGHRRLRQAALAGGFGLGADDFAIIPYTAYQKHVRPARRQRRRGSSAASFRISDRRPAARGRDAADAMAEVER